jgi:hypothetical protein
METKLKIYTSVAYQKSNYSVGNRMHSWMDGRSQWICQWMDTWIILCVSGLRLSLSRAHLNALENECRRHCYRLHARPGLADRPPAADLSFSHVVQTIKHTVNPEQQLTNKWPIASGLKQWSCRSARLINCAFVNALSLRARRPRIRTYIIVTH